MSTQTTNYNLIKPSQDDDYNIDIHNGNMDKIDEKIYGIEKSFQDVQDYSFGVKSDIDLSSGDVILQEIDYCKGLLVIDTTYDTNALILPTTNSYRYSIYNSDESKGALVKKTGGNPIEIAPNTMVMVGYDGTDYRMLGGGASDATRFKPSSIDEAVGDLTVVGWDKEDGMWKAMQNGYALYYDEHLYGNGSRVPITGLEADDGLVAFVNEDGTLTSDGTKVRAGYIVEVGKNLLLDLKGDLGVAKEYTANMQTAYAVIGKSQTCRVKSEMPDDADGYYLCYKDVAWAEGDDENTGTLVGNFTENYIGDNVWHTVEGLQNNNIYYFKWFPYKGDVVNRVVGVNENSIFVQNGMAFWDFDRGIAGNIIGDNWNDYDLTNTNIPYIPFKIGNGVRLGGTGNRLSRIDFMPNVFTILMWFETPDTATKFITGILESVGSWGGWYIEFYNMKFRVYIGNNAGDGGSGYLSFNTALSVKTPYFIGATFNKSNGAVTLRINEGKETLIKNERIVSDSTSYFIGYRQAQGIYSSDFKADQIMIVEGEISDENFAKLYNGGEGC